MNTMKRNCENKLNNHITKTISKRGRMFVVYGRAKPTAENPEPKIFAA